jgi:16S rRNA (cytosine1402-N4)-methyltransferase
MMNLHTPVLLREVLEGLNIKSNGVYVDATFGRGGHSIEILKRLSSSGRLFVIDKDVAAISVAEELNDARVFIKHGSYTELYSWMAEFNLVGKVDGILLDLGVSSPQLDEGGRGFSFLRDGPLDMRMDITQKLTAATVVNSYKESDLANIFYKFGEERYSKRIAKAIVHARGIEPITGTLQLANIVSEAHPKWERGKNPATRVFQALRIYVNKELEELESCLEQCLDVLSVNGRLLVISFHSLEEQIVKQFIRKYGKGDLLPAEVPIKHEQLNIRLKSLGQKLKASEPEVKNNPRARSAVLRVMEKVL